MRDCSGDGGGLGAMVVVCRDSYKIRLHFDLSKYQRPL
jgi:hypothetical protein